MTLPAQAVADVWLLADGADAVLWVADDRRVDGRVRLSLAQPSRQATPPTLRELRDQGARWGLDQVLVPALAGLLGAALASAARVRLHLDAALPEAWHRCPYEYLRREGQTLHGRLTVSRYDPPAPGPTPLIAPGREIVVLNHLPRTDPEQPWRRALGLAQVIGPAAVGQYLRQADLPHLAALIVVAHGTEDRDDHPFRAADGRSWALPTARGLPPLVILLACGDEDGNLIDLGRQLLAAGARTVIAPLGRPSLTGAGEFLADFLPAWVAGARVDAALGAAASPPAAAGGARRLLLLGAPDLRRQGAEVPHDAWSDDRLVRAVQQNDTRALVTLLERLTRRHLLAGESLDGAETTLRRLLGVTPANEPREQWLLGLLSAVEPGLTGHQTRAWVGSLLALLAEAYAQDLIPRCEALRKALNTAGVTLTPRLLHGWSRLYYRRGRYGLSLRDVALGIQGMARSDPDLQTTDFLGHLLDLAIDLNLPAPARTLAVELDDILAHQHQAEADWQRHKLRDRQARIALRTGELRQALTHFRLKRDEAINRYERDGARELAWLLYVSAWLPDAGPGERAEMSQWLDEARAALAAQPDLGAVGAGNYDVLYLLRACAAYGWRQGDRGALDLVLACQEPLRQRLFAVNQDPGPPGFCFAFLHLAARAGSLPGPLGTPAWEEIRTAMADHRYFFELASLAHLLGRAADAREYLDRFQAQRRLPAGVGFPDWFLAGGLSQWAQLCAGRAAFERQVLVVDGGEDVDGLAMSGLLPI